MATGFDNLPKQLQSLQLLIDQFRDADDWEERDEVLADIIAHDTPEAIGFLRLVANNPDEDVYARCDALCGLVLRTNGKEFADQMLVYLDDPESVYEFCRAADTAGDIALAAAAPKLWAAWEKEIENEARQSVILALESVDPAGAAKRLTEELLTQDALEKLSYERADLILKSLARLRNQEAKQALTDWETKLRTLAKAHPDDEAEFEDIADLAREAIVRIDEPEDGPPEKNADDEDDDL